jgi:spermidine synthase
MPIYKKWFCEEAVPGARLKKIKHCFLIDKLIFKGKTPLQEVLIFDNPVYGRIFCLDDIIEFSEKDEFIYHEMISHPVLFSHPDPKNILIIGGGDGGVLKEVLKHPIKKVDLVEIDKEVIKISKKYLRSVCKDSFSDKRVKIYNLPGESFIKEKKSLYDVVIIDCTNFELEGPSFPIYLVKFYKEVFSALRREGILITLGASFLDFESFIKKIFKRLNKVFPYSVIYKFCMPSYHCGEYSFIAGSKKINLEKIDFEKIKMRFDKIAKKHKFKYYSPAVHQASMVLPNIWQVK